MQLPSFKDILRGNKSTGAWLHLGDESQELHYVTLAINKEVLERAGEGQWSSVEEMGKEVDKNGAIALVLTGKGIMVKNAEFSEGASVGYYLDAVLPNAKQEDFYLQAARVGESEVAVALARKEMVDGILEELTQHGLIITDIHLGPAVTSVLAPVAGDGNYSVGTHTMRFSEGRLSALEENSSLNENDTARIGGENLDERYVMGYAAAFHYFFPSGYTPLSDTAFGGKEEYTAKRRFKFGGIAAAAFFLLLLLGNWLVNSSRQGRFETLNTQVAGYQGQLNRVSQLQASIEEKKELAARLGYTSTSRSSFYADRLVAVAPSQVSLTRMAINPLEVKRTDGKPETVFGNKAIEIEGTAAKSTFLNEWVDAIETYDFVEKVSIVGYSQPVSNEPGQFQIKVNVR